MIELTDYFSLTINTHSVKSNLKARYKNVAGRIITMALESVDYSEEKACKILEIVMQDDKNTATKDGEIQHEVKGDACVDNEAAAPSTNLTADQSKESPETANDER